MKASVWLETPFSLFDCCHFFVHIRCLFLHVCCIWNDLWNRSFYLRHFSDRRFKKRFEIIERNGESQTKSTKNIENSFGFRSTLFDGKTVKYRLLFGACKLFRSMRWINFKDHSRFVHDFLEIYQPMFTIICTWSLVTICEVMLLVQMELVEYFIQINFRQFGPWNSFFFDLFSKNTVQPYWLWHSPMELMHSDSNCYYANSVNEWVMHSRISPMKF